MAFFSAAPKTLKYKELDKMLKHVAGIDSVERAYILGLFRQYESGGITKQEIEKVIREMRTNTKDSIDPEEAKRVEEALLSHL